MRLLRFCQIAVAMALSLWVMPVLAQNTPGQLAGSCEVNNPATNSLDCILEVPANTIGSSLDISFPKGTITQVRNLRQGENMPSSSVFFKLEISDQGQQFLMEVDFAEMSTEVFASSPYRLVSFEIIVSDLTAADLNVDGMIEIGSELFDPSSLENDTAAFAADNDIPLPFSLGALPPVVVQIEVPEVIPEPEPAAPAEIGSSFSVEQPETPATTSFGGSSDGGELRGSAPAPAASLYCFDDAKISMKEDEWAIICEAKNRGFVSGNPRGDGFVFLPNNTINRAEAMKILTVGILKTLGTLSQSDFDAMENLIDSLFGGAPFIGYPDITFDSGGLAPWFALYVQLASENDIASGYPDGTFQPGNTIINAETYKVVVETAALASDSIASALEKAARDTADDAWFMRYAQVLDEFDIDFSANFEAPTKRKDFMILVMELLNKVGV